MAQTFFTQQNLDTARMRYPEKLRKIDNILKKVLAWTKSLLDESVTADEAEQAIVDVFERRLHQHELDLNLEAYARAYGSISWFDGCYTVRQKIFALADHAAEIRAAIKRQRALGT